VLLLASITSSITSGIGDYGIYAVFGLMVVSALLPAASELTMLYGGALAGGAFADQHLTLFGSRISTPAWGFVAVALAGVAGTVLGALIGWTIGAFGGRPFLERHGRWLHVSHAKLERAEAWFDRYGSVTVAVGLALPLVRSFISIPAGVVRMPLHRFIPLAVIGSSIFCFALAGAGWALGSQYNRLHDDLSIVGLALLAVVLAALVYVFARRRSSRLTRRAHDPSG
jgi:membrane protein DedA with SNARE-associated domain